MTLEAGTAVASLLTLCFLGGSAAAYSHWIRRLLTRGGLVATTQVRTVDLLAASILVFFFLGLAALSFALAARNEITLHVQDLLTDFFLKLVILGGALAFLRLRQISLVDFFGWRKIPVARATGHAALFLFAALPSVALAAYLSSLFVHGTDEQVMVTLFREQARDGKIGGILAVFASAALFAPVFEELLFRGFFYTTLKRYLGPIVSALLTSAIFAATHANLPSLAPLFVLALCFTVAFESTGSLLVPMVMHALFNSLNLTYMYLEALKILP